MKCLCILSTPWENTQRFMEVCSPAKSDRPCGTKDQPLHHSPKVYTCWLYHQSSWRSSHVFIASILNSPKCTRFSSHFFTSKLLHLDHSLRQHLWGVEVLLSVAGLCRAVLLHQNCLPWSRHMGWKLDGYKPSPVKMVVTSGNVLWSSPKMWHIIQLLTSGMGQRSRRKSSSQESWDTPALKNLLKWCISNINIISTYQL